MTESISKHSFNVETIWDGLETNPAAINFHLGDHQNKCLYFYLSDLLHSIKWKQLNCATPNQDFREGRIKSLLSQTLLWDLTADQSLYVMKMKGPKCLCIYINSSTLNHQHFRFSRWLWFMLIWLRGFNMKACLVPLYTIQSVQTVRQKGSRP